jgi:catechol 2,3-dioxygenase-like lactoylglutathione lyase family enzyme
MAKVVFGNHASVIVPRQDRDAVRTFYGEVLGGSFSHQEDDKDLFCLGGGFHIAFLYGDYADERKFLRSGRAIWLEIKSDDVAAMGRKILESGLAEKLEIPDPHLYFQAPGGQCLRLVAIDEDLSRYEGVGEGPDVARVKETVRRLAQ